MTWTDATTGIIIGSLFTILCFIIQGYISWRIEERRHRLNQRSQTETDKRNSHREWIRKREEAYLVFADCYGFLLASMGAALAGNLQMVTDKINAAFLEKTAHALTSIRLFGSDAVFSAARQFAQLFINRTTREGIDPKAIVEMDEQLGAVVELMNRELAKAYSEGD